MERKLLDVYGIIGILISVIVALVTIYSPLKEIAFEYIIIAVIVILIIEITMFLLNKFAIINNQIQRVKVNSNQIRNDLKILKTEFSSIDKRFKTIEDLNDIRSDIKIIKQKLRIR